ncbi:MAG: hypothetical protein PHO54_05995 [Candidatus Peribacteraceae bacterium]|nr:hypothetical protein [Candidatus Peribacteraceae bacterium]
MPSVFSLIGRSWEFAWKQAVLFRIIFWLLILPSLAINLLETLTGTLHIFPETVEISVLILLVDLILSVVILWGSACVIIIGRRLLRKKAGRSRSSFPAVRLEASHFVMPLLFTGILRACFTIFWGLLLIVPGIVYALRTSFCNLVVIFERKSFRKALRRSKVITRGRLKWIFWYLLALLVILYAPLNVCLGLLGGFAQNRGINFLVALDLADAVLNALASVLFSFSLILLYGEFTKHTNID